MLDGSIRILNFDDSVLHQKNLWLKYKSKIIDLTSLAQRARLFMNSRLRRKIKSFTGDTLNPAVTFLGSGDFHHISEILTSTIAEPATLIVFDFHPDWDIMPPYFGCGSWVSRALENKNIKKCVLIAASSEDLSWPGILTANLASLKNNRLEIYPYKHSPSRMAMRKIPENISMKTNKGLFFKEIIWDELQNKDFNGFISNLISRLPSNKVYISIDKDCLCRESAVTNWEEGFLKLDELLLMLKNLKDNLDIIGLDITGDYSLVSVQNKFKAALSRLDHPKKNPLEGISAEVALSRNQNTNLRILETLI